MAEPKLLVLDLDETLIYAAEDRLPLDHQLVAGQYFVYERPFVKEFLEYCLTNFEVGVWTTATTSYASHILTSLVGELSRLSFVWTRDRCTWVFDEESNERIQVKKLEKLLRKGYRAESILVVDDSPLV